MHFQDKEAKYFLRVVLFSRKKQFLASKLRSIQFPYDMARKKLYSTLRPFARLIARNGLRTRHTRRILTTEIAPELIKKTQHYSEAFVSRGKG